MKTCSYCGKQYPDHVTICPNDQQSLGEPGEGHNVAAGTWHGSYNYFGNSERDVPFTLQLKQDAQEFTDNDEARGLWVIEPWEIPLADGMSLEMSEHPAVG